MVTDPIADFINRLKSAGCVKKGSVVIPYSQLKFLIAKALEKEGYIGQVSKKGRKVKKYLEVCLHYDNDVARIQGATRISRPSRRVYMGAKNIKPVRQGNGLLLLSTPKGILSGEEARKKNVGGEALFKIW